MDIYEKQKKDTDISEAKKYSWSATKQDFPLQIL